jgi:hypothetical protein
MQRSVPAKRGVATPHSRATARPRPSCHVRLLPAAAFSPLRPALCQGGRPSGRRDVQAAAGASQASLQPDGSLSWRKRFWTFVDVVAILGSVGGALAAILNLVTGTAVLYLPLILPVVSLLASLQRESVISEVIGD